MKSLLLRQSIGSAVLVTALLLPVAHAYPPAPHHVLFGSVRDEMGNPIQVKNAQLILETVTGVVLKSQVIPGLRPGANYRITVPMDSRVHDDVYLPTALRPTAPFKITVNIGKVAYLPIEMSGDHARLGRLGGETRLDLTLGEDSDGDGLPDAWERAISARSGLNLDLASVKPDDDSDHDGLSNLDEYLVGTYALDAKDGFQLNIVKSRGSISTLEFTAVRGRTYSMLSSSDAIIWKPQTFRLPTDDASQPSRSSFQATSVTLMRVSVENPIESPTRFFKLMVH